VSLERKVAVVTGAASGIGRATVGLLAERGASVVAVDLAPSVAELAADGIVPLEGDVTDVAVAERAVATATDRFGRLDVLVNNAGYSVWVPLLETNEEDWDRIFAVNVKSMFLFSRAAVPVMQRGGGGAIVNTASISGLVGLPGQTAYCASKGAVVMLTRQLAVEHAPARIRVNAVAPGAIDTPFLQNVLDGVPDPDALAEGIAASHPLGRIGGPDEVARAIVWLASPDADFVTGAIVPVDGGYTAQ
jgi:NAD(P)-dependent dehydrogenase (short-subunit alcohol dehydrogenase family)